MITAGLSIYSAQRLEVLLDKLAQELATAPLHPLEREVIVVQSRGMYRWVTLELAKRLGIAATLATPFPGTFCRALAERIDGTHEFAPSERYEQSAPTAFERDPLAWRIFQLLLGGPKPVTAPAAAYIKDDTDGRLRFQLASRLAARFDDYQLYRPDMLLAWERGEQPFDSSPQRDTARWQAAIWRSIREGTGSAKHLAQRFGELIDLLGRAERAPNGTPSRVSVFGAASLPPIFLQVLDALSRFVRVALYVASPTSEYWSDLRSERDVAKQLDLFAARGIAGKDAHVEIGNSLLASLGRQGQELDALLQALDRDGSAREQLAAPLPERTTVLGILQADIVELVERGRDDGGEPPLPLSQRDRSLTVHVCHSPMREMQVLRDLILDAFAHDSSLRPDEIFVLAPDIATYTPFIQAVFGVAHDGEPTLRFTIADRTARGEEPLVDAVLRFLGLVGSRVAASDVLALLDTTAVRRAAHIEASEIESLRSWVTSTPIRWGIDGAHRCETLGVPAGALDAVDAADSWRGGLDRLLLGCAIDGDDTLVGGRLPSARAAGDADLLGRFVRFIDRLFVALENLSHSRPLGEWARDLGAMCTAFVEPSDEAEDAALAALLESVSHLAELQELSGCSESITIETARDALEAEMSRAGGGAGFLSGAITFCSLQPMRAIPAKILAVVGLDDGVFPRRDRPASFDLVAAAPRLGDRSTKDDDRYLLLETLLAARGRLILSYVGRSQKDNRKLAPSSVLSELEAAVNRSFVAGDARPAWAHLTTVHALQPFSERYFSRSDDVSDDSALPKSYSTAGCRAALAARIDTRHVVAFTGRALAADELIRDIELEDLTEFWVNPSKYFCTRTLGLRLPKDEPLIADSEPFLLDHLTDYQLSEHVLERRLVGLTAGEEELTLLRASGTLPHAELARAAYERVSEEIDDLIATIDSVFHGRPVARSPLAIDAHGDDWRLTGIVAHLTDQGRLRYRPATLKPKDRLRAWITHLALNTVSPQASFLVGTEKKDTKRGPRYLVLRMNPIDGAAARLGALVRGYRDGHREPLPVFERASYEYASRTRNRRLGGTKQKSDPYEAAVGKFKTSGYGWPGDDADPYVALCTRDRNLFTEEEERFRELALELWEPLLEATEEAES